MSRVEKDPIRDRLEEHYGDDWNAHVFAMDAALRAVLDLHPLVPHNDPTNATLCRCCGSLEFCRERRVIAAALGVES